MRKMIRRLWHDLTHRAYEHMSAHIPIEKQWSYLLGLIEPKVFLQTPLYDRRLPMVHAIAANAVECQRVLNQITIALKKNYPIADEMDLIQPKPLTVLAYFQDSDGFMINPQTHLEECIQCSETMISYFIGEQISPTNRQHLMLNIHHLKDYFQSLYDVQRVIIDL